MNKIKFTKMNGAGNDFIVLDAFPDGIQIDLSSEKIREMCDRRKGIGADGLLYLKPSEEFDYELDYFNADGNLGSLCANGSRCSIKYACENIFENKTSARFICNDKIYSGELLKQDKVKFILNEYRILDLNFSVKYDNHVLNCCYIDTGSPHVILFWDKINNLFSDDFENFDMIGFGAKVRYAEEFQPTGTNVNIIRETSGKFFIRTFERGVENETLSCGTGTIASAIALYHIRKINSPMTFHTFGKDRLSVDFEIKNSEISKITLTGPVKINYIGSYIF